ncbi:MAG TPA: hypothetical protein VHS58_18950, partial [Acetobacteraceae bacterium]|nr:hypothetical protein [Acetobacteraceae bacterium]
MGEYGGAFIASDVAKTKHAVAVAEAGRSGEVRFVGEVENTPAGIERTRRQDSYDVRLVRDKGRVSRAILLNDG